jgi:hypothetical protein
MRELRTGRRQEKAMKPKRDLFAVLGWITWKVLAVLGLRYAKDKIASRQDSNDSGSATPS